MGLQMNAVVHFNIGLEFQFKRHMRRNLVLKATIGMREMSN